MVAADFSLQVCPSAAVAFRDAPLHTLAVASGYLSDSSIQLKAV